MALSLRAPESQAKVSSWLVIASLVLLLLALAAASVKGGFNWEAREFVYGQASTRVLVVFGIGGIGLLAGCGAFWLAYSSAGERRNPRSGLSWACFAASAAIITFTCIFLYAYKFMALVVRPSA